MNQPPIAPHRDLQEHTTCYLCRALTECRPLQLPDHTWCWACDTCSDTQPPASLFG